MKFNQWNDRLVAAHDKVKDIAIYEISESIAINGCSITITLGKEIVTLIDGNQSHIRHLRHLFTHAKSEFEAMLESLESSASTCAEAMGELLSVVTHEIVPELVINRIAGEEVSGDNREMLQHMVNKKMGELWEVFIKSEGVFNEFIFSLAISEDTNLLVGFYPKPRINFRSDLGSGQINCTTLGVSKTGNKWELSPDQITVEGGLRFLGLFEQIKAKLARFIDQS